MTQLLTLGGWLSEDPVMIIIEEGTGITHCTTQPPVVSGRISYFALYNKVLGIVGDFRFFFFFLNSFAVLSILRKWLYSLLRR
jgi:hypothetical protein